MDDKKAGKVSATGIDRRSMLKMGVAGAAGSMLLPGAARAADEKKPVGNYPKGVEGDSVFIGLTLDITGPYSAQGADQQKGYELAVEQLNAGAAEMKKISPLTKKGVLGKRSEEHTYELQSLMRISYAVIRLQKKNHVS